jgi:hypothetical protein
VEESCGEEPHQVGRDNPGSSHHLVFSLLSPLSHRWQTHPGEHRSSSESFMKSASSFFHGIIHSASLGSFSLGMKQWPIPICSSAVQIAVMRTKTVVRPLAVLQIFRLHYCRFSSVMQTLVIPPHIPSFLSRCRNYGEGKTVRYIDSSDPDLKC